VSRKIIFNRSALLVGAFALAFWFSAARALSAGQGAVTTTVTAVGKKDISAPAVKKEDVQLFLNKERTQIANWQRGEKLYLAVLIDDSLDNTVASQWSDLKEFFNAQPQTTYISVAYARNGSAMLAQDFTSQERYNITPGSAFGADNKAQSLFRALDVAGVPFYADPYCPEGTLYLINTNYLSLFLHERAAFSFTGFESTLPNNQLGYIGAILSLLELVDVKCKAHGKFDGLAFLNI